MGEVSIQPNTALKVVDCRNGWNKAETKGEAKTRARDTMALSYKDFSRAFESFAVPKP